MKGFIYWLAAACLLAGLSPAAIVFAYDNDTNGNTVDPTVGASTVSTFLATSWIFGEMSVDPSWIGQPIWGSAVRITNPTPDPISVGLYTGIWAADGLGGGPGTLLDEGFSGTISFLPADNFIILFTNFPVPAGDFWMGYAFETFGASTTAAELNSLQYDLGDAPTVGTTSTPALLGSQIGNLGSNPAISGSAGGFLSQSIQMQIADAPEASSGLLGAGGILLLAVAGFYRRRKLNKARLFIERAGF